MAQRPSLQTILSQIQGVSKVYFQPPESIKMVYPCIVYELGAYNVKYANNSKYKKMDRYTVTIIDRNPYSIIRNGVDRLPYCTFDRGFCLDNLYHFVYTLYY